ncbi:MAG TPA: GTP 3',8-cyclase MoaA [Deltaproteobacteria bacterium]|nr:GTP 3',8-cyclase MoaA [Deltaproteobacteria bacterium]
MLDKYRREINYLRVSITDRCNLHCTYCRPKEGISIKGHDDILRYEEIIRIISVAVEMGLVKVRVTGGEPLVRRNFIGFIASLKNIAGLRDISLTTNGILLEKFTRDIFNAGIHRINISLDSLKEEKYKTITGGGDLRAVLRGIEKSRKIGFAPIKINTVVMKGLNDDEVLDFAQMAFENPFQIRFIELMPFGQAQELHARNYISIDCIRDTISKRYKIDEIEGKKNSSDGPAKIFRLREGLGEIGFISPLSSHFCATCNRLRLTADGKLRSCLLSDDEIDLKGQLRRNCTDAELKKYIYEAITLKPGHHHITCAETHLKKCQRGMSTIGG